MLTNQNNFSLVPTTLDEAMKFAEIISKSSLCPNSFKGKSGDVMLAIEMGREVGLRPMQALQNIAVINGRPCLWGDALLAVARAHPDFEWINESQTEELATCEVKRKSAPPQIRTFSKDDAIKAGLWGKQGPWTTYPKRMLQMRARGFCLRDVMPDALRGLNLAEEVIDIPQNGYKVIDKEELNHRINDSINNKIDIKIEESNIKSGSFEHIKQRILNATNNQSLSEAAFLAAHLTEEERKELKPLYVEKRNKLKNGE